MNNAPPDTPGDEDVPEVCGWRVATKLVPAPTTGGDILGVARKGSLILLWVGDISGKGARAELLSASVGTLVRDQAETMVDPARIVNRVARLCYEDLAASHAFLTLFVAAVDTDSGRAQVVDAGHAYWGLRRLGGAWVEDGETRGLPLGFEPEPSYVSSSWQLERGDHLVAYTDGLVALWEEQDRETCIGELGRLIDGVVSRGPERLVESVFEALERKPQGDDRAMIVLERSMDMGPVRVRLDVDLAELDRVNEVAERFTASHALGPASSYEVELALTEAFTNIVRYAYPNRAAPEKDVEIRLWVDGGALHGRIVDGGVPFDLPTPGEVDERGGLGGKGLEVIKAIVSDVSFRRNGEANVMEIKKLLV